MNQYTPNKPLIERAMEKVMPITESGCWIWLGALDGKGYGRIWKGPGQWVAAHRVVYESIKGLIQDGLELDHLCRVRCCVNPAHLEAVTPWENKLRGNCPIAANARKTHCVHGHPLSGDNLVMKKSHDKYFRTCRICKTANWQRWKAKSALRTALEAREETKS